MNLSNIFNILNIYLGYICPMPIIIYHAISNNNLRDAIPLENFKRHLDFFKENKYDIISLHRFNEILRSKKEIKRSNHSVCLTFDDGYEDFFHNAWPLLRDYRLPAALFIIANRIGQKGYLNLAQIKEMLSSHLISIGSHSMGHGYLPELDLGQLDYEIKESKSVLEMKLGCTIDFFSYPWGGFSARIKELVKDAGYKAAFTTNQGITRTHRHSDIYCLKRITMGRKDNYLKFLIKVSGLGYCFSRKIKT